ncbi:twin-arginine translocation signal domain-containing protein [Streptomyces sp. 7N604]|uniref:twin-arginine translocation signal domain-containing protein n=1 Tax=Streptomyces sp. 7N604 TaxID=3457415 RepID=UPI003FCF6843
MGRADIERRDFLTKAAYSVAGAALPLGVAGEIQARTERALTGGIVGAAEVEAVRDMVAMFTAHRRAPWRAARAQYRRPIPH